ncbi:MAG: ribonuclease H-like domain-containing protein [Acidobacteria bacterium]|nr:ribonuclease H-like domain-containing protein [Acidobacteriota bacterium]
MPNDPTEYFIDLECSLDEAAEAELKMLLTAGSTAPSDLSNVEFQQTIERKIREACLKAEWSRVLVIGLISVWPGQEAKRCLIGCDPATGKFYEEVRALQRFWEHLKYFDPRRDRIIGHNIYDFDLPFLYKRSIIQQVRPTVDLSFARYRAQPIYDTMKEWEKWGRGAVSLDNLAKSLHLESPKKGGIDGSQVYDFYRAGRHREIAEYCGRDVISVREIYKRLTFTE